MKKSHLNIKSWSKEDRPREKLMLKGVETLSDAELIAILIGSGSKDISAVELSKQILSSVGNNLTELGKITTDGFQQFKGIGKVKAISIIAAMELSRRRMLTGRIEATVVTCSKDLYNYIGPQLMDLKHEEFWLILLNRRLQITKKILIGKGGIGAVYVDKTILFKSAVVNLASSIVIVHNHPSGQPKPSGQDDELTKQISKSGEILGIKLADHIIVAGDLYYSYMDEGRL